MFYQAAVIDGLLIPSDKVTSLYVKAREVTYCCGPYDARLAQARREKVCAAHTKFTTTNLSMDRISILGIELDLA